MYDVSIRMCSKLPDRLLGVFGGGDGVESGKGEGKVRGKGRAL